MLEDGSHSFDGKRPLPYKGRGHCILETNAELGFSGGNQYFGTAFWRLYDLHFQAGILKISLFLSHIQAGMVGIGSPIQDEGDFWGSLALPVPAEGTRAPVLGLQAARERASAAMVTVIHVFS